MPNLIERLKLLDSFVDVCDAVAYAHSRGVVHRDLKPDNLMLSDFGETLVVDWGLAKVKTEDEASTKKDETRTLKKATRHLLPQEIMQRLQEQSEAAAAAELEEESATTARRPALDPAKRASSLAKALESSYQPTMDGSIIGTPTYMPPEQARGDLQAVDELSDVYSLSAMLYELIAGRPPYRGQTATQVVELVLVHAPDPLGKVTPEAPRELISLCESAMARERSERLPSALELAEQVRAYREGRTLSVYHYSSYELLKRFVTRNRRAVAVALIALALLAGTTSYLRVTQANKDAESARQAQAAFAEQVNLRQRELNALDRAAAELDPAGLIQSVQHTLELTESGAGDPWSPRAAVARTNQLTPEVRTAARGLLQRLSDLIQIKRDYIELARRPVSGKAHAFLTERDEQVRGAELLELQSQAFMLALHTEEYTAAQLVLGGMGLEEERAASHEAELQRARNSVVNAWISIIGVALDDLEHPDPLRSTRFDEVYGKLGFAPLKAEEYARKLGGFRHVRVAEYLVERLEPYIEKAQRPMAANLWTDQDRQALHLLLTLLGDIQYPDVATPVLGRFLRVATDQQSGENIVVQIGYALSATESRAALRVLQDWLFGLQKGRFPEESAMISKSLSRLRAVPIEDDSTPEGLREQAATLLYAGDLEGAITFASRAIELDAEDYSAFEMRGKARFQQGHFEQAIQDFDESIRLHSTTGAMINRAIAHQRQGNLNAAIEDLGAVIEVDENNHRAWYSMGNCFLVARLNDQAMKCYQRAIELDPSFAEVYAQRAYLHFEKGKLPKALADCETALSYNPNTYQAHYMIGMIQNDLGEYQKALASLNQAAQLQPTDTATLCERAESRAALNDVEGALRDFEPALKIDPDNSNTLLLRGQLYLSRQQMNKAYDDLKRSYELNTEGYEIHYLVAQVLSVRGEWEKAATFYLRSVELKPDFGVGWAMLGVMRHKLGQTKEGMQAVNKGVELSPMEFDVWKSRGILRLQSGDHLGAIEDFSRALAITSDTPESMEVYFARSRARSATGDKQGALADLNRVTQISPKQSSAYINRGVIYLDLNDPVAACHEFEEALALDPDHVSAIANLASAYINMRKYERVQELLDHGLKLQSEMPELWLLQGQLQHRQRKYEQAQRSFEKALELAPENWPHRDALAKDYNKIRIWLGIKEWEYKFDEAKDSLEFVYVASAHFRLALEREEDGESSERIDEQMRIAFAALLKGGTGLEDPERESAREISFRGVSRDMIQVLRDRRYYFECLELFTTVLDTETTEAIDWYEVARVKAMLAHEVQANTLVVLGESTEDKAAKEEQFRNQSEEVRAQIIKQAKDDAFAYLDFAMKGGIRQGSRHAQGARVCESA